MAIKQFKGQYAYLSNFYSSPIIYQGLTYPTVEHAYQAAKTNDPHTKIKIAQKQTPAQAKRAGGSRGIIQDFNHTQWETRKDQIMLDLIRIKFKHTQLAQLLLDTQDQQLEEGNTWNDTYWGLNIKTGKGKNMLGQILMQVRQEIKNIIPHNS